MTQTNTGTSARPQARSGAPFSGPTATDRVAIGRQRAQRLGSTGIGFTAKDSAEESARDARFRLQAKMRHFADRTMVVASEKLDHMTGEFVAGRMVPRDDKFLACGRRIRSTGGDVGVHLQDGKAGLSNLQSCGSGWVCPVCSGKIQASRAAELGAVLAYGREQKHTLAMITLTVRHKRGDSLSSVWDAVSAGWHAVTGGQGPKYWGSEKSEDFLERLGRWEQGCFEAAAGRGRWPRGGRAGIRPVRRVGDREARGVVGWARAVEVTHGLNGWHVHVHAVVMLEGDATTAKANALLLADSMFDRWQTGIVKAGFTAVKALGGLHVTVAEGASKRLAEYLTKDQFGTGDTAEKIRASVGKKGRKLALEAALGDAKRGKRGGRTPFQVLDEIDFADPGQDLAIWREWVSGSAGRLALTWSRGFRALVPDLPDEPKTDEQIADEQLESAPLLSLTPAGWAVVVDRQGELLNVMEAGGLAGLIEWLRGVGLEPFVGDGSVQVLPGPPRFCARG